MNELMNFESLIDVKKGDYITKKEAKEGPYPVILGGKEPAYYIDRFNHTGKAIVVSRSGASAGYVSIWDEPIFITDGFLIEPKPEYDYDFVYYALKNCEGILQGRQSGAAIPHVTPRLINSIEVYVPAIEIQRKISSILSSYDRLIENNQKQIKLLEEAAQRLYKEWFVDLHFPGHEDACIIDGLPKGWYRGAIDSRISLLSGYAFKSAEFVENGQYKIVTIKNVKNGEFDGSNVSLMNEIPSKMPKHCILEKGDILLSLTGNVGRVCLVYGENYLLNQRVAKLKSDIPGFTYCLFRSKDLFDEMNSLANGAAQQNLSPIRTGKIEISFPSEDIIQRFESLARPIINKVIELNKMNVVLTEARDRLLPKLMSGEIEL